jgi:hypothetical protein
MEKAHYEMKLLPMLLKHGLSYEMPIAVVGCKRIIIHAVKYLNPTRSDYIIRCEVDVKGNTYNFLRSEKYDRTYFPEGVEGKNVVVELAGEHKVDFSLNVNCKDFDACGCKERMFQLKVSLVY